MSSNGQVQSPPRSDSSFTQKRRKERKKKKEKKKERKKKIKKERNKGEKKERIGSSHLLFVFKWPSSKPA